MPQIKESLNGSLRLREWFSLCDQKKDGNLMEKKENSYRLNARGQCV